MKLLITGFEPFGGETINSSWAAVQALPDQIGPWALTKLCLPVVFGEAADLVIGQCREMCADAVICLGQAAGRSEVTPEFVGINLRHASIPDNAGAQPQDMPVDPAGPAAYFSTLPVREMVQAISDLGIPAKVSYSAGTYVCNDVLYTLMHALSSGEVRAGFIHLPPTPAQVGPDQPSMTTSSCVQALTAAISVL